MRVPALALAFGAFVAACNLVFGIKEREYDSTLDDAGSLVDGGNAGDAAAPDASKVYPPPSCADAGVLSDGNACDVFERLEGAVRIDGEGSEYCKLHATIFAVKDGKYLIPSNPGQVYPETVRLFAAWTDAGLALHAHVTKSQPQPGADPPDGDSIAFYFGTSQIGSSSTGATKGTLKIVVNPPGPNTRPLRAWLFQDGTSSHTNYFSANVNGRLVSDGYELEILVTWADLGIDGGAPTDGKVLVRFDFAVNVREGDNGSVDLVSFFENKPASGVSPCQALGQSIKPDCDTRTWCLAHLSP